MDTITRPTLAQLNKVRGTTVVCGIEGHPGGLIPELRKDSKGYYVFDYFMKQARTVRQETKYFATQKEAAFAAMLLYAGLRHPFPLFPQPEEWDPLPYTLEQIGILKTYAEKYPWGWEAIASGDSFITLCAHFGYKPESMFPSTTDTTTNIVIPPKAEPDSLLLLL